MPTTFPSSLNPFKTLGICVIFWGETSISTLFGIILSSNSTTIFWLANWYPLAYLEEDSLSIKAFDVHSDADLLGSTRYWERIDQFDDPIELNSPKRPARLLNSRPQIQGDRVTEEINPTAEQYAFWKQNSDSRSPRRLQDPLLIFTPPIFIRLTPIYFLKEESFYRLPRTVSSLFLRKWYYLEKYTSYFHWLCKYLQ